MANNENKKAKKITARIFFFSQNEYNNKAKKSLNFNEENIKACISHKTIKDWAYIHHDKDLYSQEDIDKLMKIYTSINEKVGDLKPAHWHGVLRTDRATDINTIAKWLNVPMQQIEIPRGGNRAFLDCVEYLTHEDDKQQDEGKYLYPDEEVKANFNFRKELIERKEKLLKYGKELNEV